MLLSNVRVQLYVQDPKWVRVFLSRSPQKDVSFLEQDRVEEGLGAKRLAWRHSALFSLLENLTLSLQAGFFLFCFVVVSVTWWVWACTTR